MDTKSDKVEKPQEQQPGPRSEKTCSGPRCAAAGCEKAGKNRCSICKGTFYCSVDCQKASWKEHKKVCSPSNAAPNARAAASAPNAAAPGQGISPELAKADAAIANFWVQWEEMKPAVERAIKTGAYGGLWDRINELVEAIHPELEWELCGGSRATHCLVVSAKGDKKVRPFADRWCAAAPKDDPVFEFAPARVVRKLCHGGVDMDMVIDGFTINARDMIVQTFGGIDRLDIAVWHPGFPSMSPETRARVAFLMLDGALGEDVVETCIGGIERPTQRPPNGIPFTQLRAKVEEFVKRRDGGQSCSATAEEQQAALEAGVREYLATMEHHGKCQPDAAVDSTPLLYAPVGLFDSKATPFYAFPQGESCYAVSPQELRDLEQTGTQSELFLNLFAKTLLGGFEPNTARAATKLMFRSTQEGEEGTLLTLIDASKDLGVLRELCVQLFSAGDVWRCFKTKPTHIKRVLPNAVIHEDNVQRFVELVRSRGAYGVVVVGVTEPHVAGLLPPQLFWEENEQLLDAINAKHPKGGVMRMGTDKPPLKDDGEGDLRDCVPPFEWAIHTADVAAIARLMMRRHKALRMYVGKRVNQVGEEEGYWTQMADAESKVKVVDNSSVGGLLSLTEGPLWGFSLMIFKPGCCAKEQPFWRTRITGSLISPPLLDPPSLELFWREFQLLAYSVSGTRHQVQTELIRQARAKAPKQAWPH